jgi:large subunit ribosomal protein L22
MTEIKAQLRHVRVSSRKMRLVANAIKGLPVHEAERRLMMLTQRSAPLVLKTLRSAVANARHNAELKAEDLFVKTIIVNQGVALKRIRPAAMGAAHGYKKHAAHLEITLGVKQAKETKKETAKTAAPVQTETAGAEPKKAAKPAAKKAAAKKAVAKKTK